MKRTSIYLEPDLEVLLKLETQRSKRPMAAIVREAVRAYVARPRKAGPPGAGAFASKHSDTAERVDDILGTTGFGTTAGKQSAAPPPTRRRRAAQPRKKAVPR